MNAGIISKVNESYLTIGEDSPMIGRFVQENARCQKEAGCGCTLAWLLPRCVRETGSMNHPENINTGAKQASTICVRV